MSQLIQIVCQQSQARKFGRLTQLYPMVLMGRFVHFVKSRGVGGAIRRSVEFAGAQARRKLGMRSLTVTPPMAETMLGLEPGEWVIIKPESEIRKTLDANDRCKGLSFLPNMSPYCGKRYRVFKRVENFFFEESKQKRKLKNTLILEGVHCHGEGIGCDRSCFLFWRESWLIRADAPQAESESRN